MMDKFTVLYTLDGMAFESVFPGLTGNYEWASKVASSTWNRDGKTITPEMMRIYKIERGDDEKPSQETKEVEKMPRR